MPPMTSASNFDAQQLLRCRRRRLEFDRALSLCPAAGGKSASLSLSNDVSYSVTLLDLGIRL